MTIEDKKKYLNEYRNLATETGIKYDNYRELRESITGIQSQRLSDMPKADPVSYDKIGETLARIDLLEGYYLHLLQKKVEIEDAINNLEDSRERLVLYLRHIDNMTIEKVAEKLFVCTQTIVRTYQSALQNIEIE